MSTDNFIGKFPINGVRYLDANGKVIESGRDFRIVLPAAKDAPPQLAGNKANSKFSSKNYMLCIGKFDFDNYSARLYEEDIVDYGTVNYSHSIGVVLYDSSYYMYAVKDTINGKTTPLFDVKLHAVLGNVYNDEELLNMSVEKIYDFLQIPVPADLKQHSSVERMPQDPIEKIKAEIKPGKDAIDVFLDLNCRADKTASWGYRLCCGDKMKKQNGEFKVSGKDNGYYMAAGLLIALENIKSNSREINLATTEDFIVKMINDDLLSGWEANDWMKNDGSTRLKNVDLLKKVKEKIDSIGPIKAYKVENLGLAS